MTLERASSTAPYRVLEPEDVERIGALRARYPQPRSAVLPALWILQEKEGILTADGLREVARAMQLAPAAVEAVASFYSMFFFRPHGRYLVEVCTGMSCLLCGAGRVLRDFEGALGVKAGETTADDLVTVLEVECVGACGGAPAAQVNHHFLENLTTERVHQVIEAMKNATLPVERFHTGRLAARDQQLLNLRDPGASRLELDPDGPAGPVVDLVKDRADVRTDDDFPTHYQGRR